MEKILEIISKSNLNELTIKLSNIGMNDIRDRDDLLFITFSCRVGSNYPTKEFLVTKECLHDIGDEMLDSILSLFTDFVYNKHYNSLASGTLSNSLLTKSSSFIKPDGTK